MANGDQGGENKKNEVVAVINAIGSLQDLVVERARQDQDTFKTLISQFKEATAGKQTFGNFILSALEAQVNLTNSYLDMFKVKK
jgi:hypothetical protein